MAGERVQGMLLFLAFILTFSVVLLLTGTAFPKYTDDGCKDAEDSISNNHLHFEFLRDNNQVIVEGQQENSIKKHHQQHLLTNEEWLTLIEDLISNESPKYVGHHGMIIHQIQNGSYNYSYGNDGTYNSRLYDKVHEKGNRGHASAMYYQMATGQTGTPPVHYQSGFAIVSQVHLVKSKGSVHWKGWEEWAFFNKYPDGSLLVYATANTAVKGRSKFTSGDTVEMKEKYASVMNATTFVAKSQSDSTTNFTKNGETTDMTSALKMFVKTSPKSELSSGEEIAFDNPKQDKTMMIIGNADGVYQNKIPGSYVYTFNASISGSIVNSTLTSNTQGYTWIDRGRLNPVQASILHHLNFLF